MSQFRSMRLELEKIATEGVGSPPHQYEEMNKKKWIQTAKDVPVALAGSMIGYGLGLTISEYVMPKLIKTPESYSKLIKAIPPTTSAMGGLASYLGMVQHNHMRSRREEASKK